MPEFDIKNDQTGEVLRVTMESPPTPEDMAEIFAHRNANAPRVAPRAPSSIQPAAETTGMLGNIGNVAMETVAGFNRPMAWLADKTIMTPINAVQQMRGKPFISLEGMVGEKGQFNGEGMITDAAAAVGELSSAFLGGGTVTRTFSSLLDDAAKYGESTLRGVIREMGRVTPSQDIAMGASAGVGGEMTAAAVEQILGEEYADEARTIGQLAFPVAASVTLQAVANIGKEMLSKASWSMTGEKNLLKAAPTPQDLKGASRAIYSKLDDAGLETTDGGIRLFADVGRVVSDNDITRDLYPVTARVANNIKRRVENGTVTWSYLDRMHSLLGRINNTNAAEAPSAAALNEVVNGAIQRLRPSNPEALGGNSVEETMQTARTLWQRGLATGKLDQIFEATRMEVLGNKKNFQEVLRSKMTSLMNDKKFLRTFQPEHRAAIEEMFKGGSARRMWELGGSLGANSADWYKAVLMGTPVAVAGSVASGNPLVIGTAVGIPVAMTASKIMSSRANAIFKQDANLMKAVIASGTDGKKVLQAYFSRTPAAQRKVEDMTALLISSGADLTALNSVPLAKSVLVGDAIYLAGIGQGIIVKENEAEQRKAP